jgi:hypothetical protein
VAAQSTFATLTGTVTDASGAVLPAATITVTNTATKNVWTVVTDNVGEYVLPNLDAGTYRITMTLSGFAVQTRETELLESFEPASDLSSERLSCNMGSADMRLRLRCRNQTSPPQHRQEQFAMWNTTQSPDNRRTFAPGGANRRRGDRTLRLAVRNVAEGPARRARMLNESAKSV